MLLMIRFFTTSTLDVIKRLRIKNLHCKNSKLETWPAKECICLFFVVVSNFISLDSFCLLCRNKGPENKIKKGAIKVAVGLYIYTNRYLEQARAFSKRFTVVPEQSITSVLGKESVRGKH